MPRGVRQPKKKTKATPTSTRAVTQAAGNVAAGVRSAGVQAAGGSRKGEFLELLAKTTGTTVGEARGIMQQVRANIRAGKTRASTTQLKRSLRGGPTAGITRTPRTSARAERKATRVVSRIAKKQRSR